MQLNTLDLILRLEQEGFASYKHDGGLILKKGEVHVIVYADGAQRWFRNGLRHREDGPAIINADVAQNPASAWWRNGQCHREDGPAFICANGHQEWRRNGELHREDGPAIINADGTQEWYRDGLRYIP